MAPDTNRSNDEKDERGSALPSQSPGPFEQPEQRAESGADPHAAVAHREDRRRLRWPRSDVIIAAATVGMLVATIGNVIVACDQRATMRGQLRLAERALDSTDRAWLIGAMSARDADDGLILAVVRFRNSGKAPAFYVRFRVVPAKTSAEPTIELPLGGLGSEITLAPGDQIEPVALPLIGISPTFAAQVRRGQGTLYVWLAIKYSDPFTGDPNVKDRYTQECWFYEPLRREFVVCPGGHIHR